jgi:prevent-host-death family protein
MVIDYGDNGSMTEVSIQSSVFKAQCLALLDQVATNHTTVLVTKHGKPVARLVPVEPDACTDESVTLLSEADEDFFSVGEAWDADV